jgi:Cof subfamily protein (haloacid dehalogenase superfamily)
MYEGLFSYFCSADGRTTSAAIHFNDYQDKTMIKALFFDIDGTLVSFKNHKIPQSAIDALKKAKAHGIGIYISTGRPKKFINNIQSIEHLIDGYITTNGACCFIGKDIISLNPIPKTEVKIITDFCTKEQVATIIVGTEHISLINSNDIVKHIFTEGLKVSADNFSDSLELTMQEEILQISPFFTIEAERKLMQHTESCISGRWHPDFTDITSVNADKAKGMKAIAKARNLTVSECMAFGDGGNDMSILRAAGIGVALGNADDEVKASADYVTTHIDDNGVANALEHFNVI